MQNNKIFILLPDGIGLRNFAYTNFYTLGKSKGYDITFWNHTAFDLSKLGFNQILIRDLRMAPLTTILKSAKQIIELRQNQKTSGDPVYASYRFQLKYGDFKAAVKSILTLWFAFRYNSAAGLEKLRNKLQQRERATTYYSECLETLKKERPSFIFCTNQRTSQGIAPLAAAKDLGIPTATFIFSWDNLPKATMVIETDYYFVWSQHMKSELLYYYPYIDANQIIITGTPQFESHFTESIIASRDDFFKAHNLDPSKKYICFSGDDVTTSPHDPDYLADVAKAVRLLDGKGRQLGIIFRRCPVDFSDRYDEVLEEYKDIIVPIAPLWKRIGRGWNTTLPLKEDLALQMNTIRHTELVINLGSSMVFDYAAHGKPCGYINYDIENTPSPGWIQKVYNFIHFRSMPDRKAVFWLNSPDEIPGKIDNILSGNRENIRYAKEWFEKINMHPPALASERIWESLSKILKA